MSRKVVASLQLSRRTTWRSKAIVARSFDGNPINCSGSEGGIGTVGARRQASRPKLNYN